MEYVTKPLGAKREDVLKIGESYGVELPQDLVIWWEESDGADVYFGYKELQFFSVDEILGEDICQLNTYLPSSFPVCMDGNGNICVARIEDGQIYGFYVADCGDLGWGESKLISKNFIDFVNDNLSPEARLNA
ncbi:SMI1/KNR4 family protein [Marinobacter xestospongiae]|uniref:SMI1/KNR4 family protein n=1 Tax=Marinobacter xestospongiae TaxID=994319 RepID=A0ABU3VZW8_9GAMM|nr:SMI1/KNR4 family protein [Marinobacter xestospongiae]MDV2079711.1 SMI1/KNR4 family protein [Marinobacter xestospongiae]